MIVNLENFDEILDKENVVVDFWAEWCGPCRVIAPVLEELAEEYAGEIVIAKLNVEKAPEIANRYCVSSIPTLIFFKNGKPMDKIVGAIPKKEIKRWIERNL